MRRILSLLCVLAVQTVVLIAAIGVDDAASQKGGEVSRMTLYELSVLHNASDMSSLESSAMKWPRAPVFLRLAMCDRLLKMMRANEKVQIFHYSHNPGTHDMRTLSGRAAWAIERVLDVKLLAAKEGMSETERIQFFHDVVSEIEKRKKVLLEGVASSTKGRSEALTAVYRGKVSQARRSFLVGVKMYELLSEWGPVGKRMQELEEITAEQGHKTNNIVTYHYSDGEQDMIFTFSVSNGVILSVAVE